MCDCEEKFFKHNERIIINTSKNPFPTGRIYIEDLDTVQYCKLYDGFIYCKYGKVHYIKKDQPILLSYDMFTGFHIQQKDYIANIDNIYLKHEYEKNKYMYDMINCSDTTKKQLHEDLKLYICYYLEYELLYMSEENLNFHGIKIVNVLSKNKVIKLSDEMVKLIIQLNEDFNKKTEKTNFLGIEEYGQRRKKHREHLISLINT